MGIYLFMHKKKFNFVSWPTVDFEYMIKNKEATDSAAVEFCSYFEQIADSPNFLRKLALEFCLRPKSLKLRHSSNWAANLFKIWQNSNASLSVAYLFLIIYLKSKVWTITRLKNSSGVYGGQYWL